MKKIFYSLLIVAIFLTTNILYAEEPSQNKELKFTEKTKTYTEPFSGTVVTIPEDWNIKEISKGKPGESKMIGFSTPNDSFAVALTVIDLYEGLGYFEKLLVKRESVDYDSILETTKKDMEKANEVDYIMLNNQKYLRAISKKRFLLKKENDENNKKEANYVYIIKLKDGYLYRFFSMTDVNYDEYKYFEKIVANTDYKFIQQK